MAEICSFDYSGRTVLVTGGTAGIGLAIAQAYRDAGASVFVTGRKPRPADYGDDINGLGYFPMMANDPAACAEALSHNVHSAGVVLNILARHREPPPPLTITTPDALQLACEPIADCNRYDSLRRTKNGTIRRDRRDGKAAALRDEGCL